MGLADGPLSSTGYKRLLQPVPRGCEGDARGCSRLLSGKPRLVVLLCNILCLQVLCPLMTCGLLVWAPGE